MKYVARFRGVNVGGKNHVKMSKLNLCFELLGFSSVSTYINSGNVLFGSERKKDAELVKETSEAFTNHFGFSVTPAVTSANEQIDFLDHAPDWWCKNPADNNTIFAMAPTTTADVMKEVGDAKPDCEQVAACGAVIFWTAAFKTFSRSRYSRIVLAVAYQYITIRSANTTKKLIELLAP